MADRLLRGSVMFNPGARFRNLSLARKLTGLAMAAWRLLAVEASAAIDALRQMAPARPRETIGAGSI